MSGKVDVADLTWEQKEKVLRFLFAKMNGARANRGHTAPPSIASESMPSIAEKAAWYVLID